MSANESNGSTLPDPQRVIAAKVRFVEEGTDAAKWARANGESHAVVRHVLSGKRACARGAARRIAVKLGIVDAEPARA